MAVKHSITSFPSDIDRDAFGYWLSGFVDGEGCFCLSWQRRNIFPRPKASFSIGLRGDDRGILETIRTFLGCGTPVRTRLHRAGNPVSTYAIATVSDLHAIIVPHFERYPLRAKKAKDFAVWKQAVGFLNDVSHSSNDPRAGQPTWTRKWTIERCQQFNGFVTALKEQRAFNAEAVKRQMLADGVPIEFDLTSESVGRE